jgi:hypothetical protein
MTNVARPYVYQYYTRNYLAGLASKSTSSFFPERASLAYDFLQAFWSSIYYNQGMDFDDG